MPEKYEYRLKRSCEVDSSRPGYVVIQLDQSSDSNNGSANGNLSWEQVWEMEELRDHIDQQANRENVVSRFFHTAREAGRYIAEQALNAPYGVVIDWDEVVDSFQLTGVDQTGKISDIPFSAEELKELYGGFIETPGIYNVLT